ncbi:peptidase M20 [Desulfolithobacter dissulfuricans]|uniref:Peptidase M20 n=1 Tax=Desulfolithobacter dissulfuricans TaxID=2795293 RepID=A0A915U083_9BACT|nr:M20 family metallopeptidase [Desulfolithobacter dissulfuricans]BCO09061.1 peptidase M20 [Desulfolithobacter dissulfuricans]
MSVDQALSFLEQRDQDLFSLLRELVLISSYTGDKSGVDRVGAVIRKRLEGLGLELETVRVREFGDHLIFRTRASHSQPYILVTGHMDTVFPEESGFNWYREDGPRVHGPGVIDMKGGLVTTIGAVQALARAGVLEQLPLVLLFNSDEEMGSPSSLELIQELARGACCGLVTECGGLSGEVVTGRRGKTGYRLEIRGQAGHAAFVGRNKASAVLELARKVLALEELNKPEQGVVVNVGIIQGGIGPNTVPEQAEARIDTRYTTRAAGLELEERIGRIAETCVTPGTTARLETTNRRPVLEETAANRDLFILAAEQARRLGIGICREVRQGVSDANTMGEFIPVLDGLGPIGEHDHSDREYMLRDSLPARTRLLTALLPALAGKFSTPAAR